MSTSIKFGLLLVATVGVAGCNSTGTQTPSASAPAVSAPKAASWDGEWTGAWGGSAATRVVVKGDVVVLYEYKGKSVSTGSTSASADRISFGTATYNVSMVKRDAGSANAHWQSGSNAADAVLTRK